jgi:hypothetical protein
MASGNYYAVTGTRNPRTDWTSAVVLSVDENGQPDKVVGVGQPCQLNAEDRKTVESLGLVLEQVTKEEAERMQLSAAVANDSAAAGPLLGDEPNQNVDQD